MRAAEDYEAILIKVILENKYGRPSESDWKILIHADSRKRASSRALVRTSKPRAHRTRGFDHRPIALLENFFLSFLQMIWATFLPDIMAGGRPPPGSTQCPIM